MKQDLLLLAKEILSSTKDLASSIRNLAESLKSAPSQEVYGAIILFLLQEAARRVGVFVDGKVEGDNIEVIFHAFGKKVGVKGKIFYPDEKGKKR